MGNLANLALGDDLDRAERLWRRSRDRSAGAGREVDRARAELGLAAVARRRGALEDALAQTLSAGERLQELGAWEAAARAEVNAALLLGLLADQADAATAARLRQQATDHISHGVAALDRLRHSLPSPAARRAPLRVRYPQLFTAALYAATVAGAADLAAALVERARMQPILAARRLTDDGYAEPPALAARPGAPAVDGQPPRLELSRAAPQLGGPGARWIGWWRHASELVRADTDSERTRIASVPFPDASRTRLDACLARPLPTETALAADDPASASRVVLERCARGPLLAEPPLAERLAATIPPHLRPAADRQPGISELTLDEILWLFSEALLGPDLLDELRRGHHGPARVILAPPPEKGGPPVAHAAPATHTARRTAHGHPAPA